MSKRFEALDAFRGIAALMVAVFHLEVIGVISELTIIKNSFLFVEFFFVLSGFVISYSNINKVNNFSDMKAFTVKRFARIWPLHIFMVMLFIPFALANLMLGVDLGDRFSLYSFVASFFLVQSLVMLGESWNLTAWSISAEFYTYIIFGLLCLVPFFKKSILLPILIVCSALFVVYNGFGINTAIFRCLGSFFLGYLAFKCYEKITVKSWMEWGILAVVLFVLSHYQNENLLYLMPFLFFLLVVVFAHESGAISNVLKGKHFQVLGMLSYSIYLTHAWFVSCFKSVSIITDKALGYSFFHMVDGDRMLDFGLGLWVNDFVYIPYIIIVVSASFFTYKHIELKAQKYINGLYFKAQK